MKNKKHESGRSMVEMVGVLAVMGLITAAAFVLIRSGMASQRRNRAIDDVSTIVAGMQNVNVSMLKEDIQGGVDVVADFEWPVNSPLGGSYSVWWDGSDTSHYYIGILDVEKCSALEKLEWPDAQSAKCTDDGLVLTYSKTSSGTVDKCAGCVPGAKECKLNATCVANDCCN